MINLTMINLNRCLYLSALTALLPPALVAHPVQQQDEPSTVTELETLEVRGRTSDLFNTAGSASQGIIGQPEFEFRPLQRSGELLEVVPGMMATQHSGDGKANQYYLRGFNLDHGTDFNTRVDGVPMNLPTHGHGQGWMDLNSIIPELIDTVEFGKGTYYASVGDFSSTGYARFNTLHSLEQGILKFEYGGYDYFRGVVANSHPISDGDVLYAGEVKYYQGPWSPGQNARKYNGLLKYTEGDYDNGFSVIGMAYYGEWNAPDQIPLHAVERGEIDRFSTVDTSDGGDSARLGLTASWWRNNNDSKSRLSAYAVYNDLHLWSNFSYFLNDPVNGDQIKQVDRRVTVGGDAEHTWFHTLSTLNIATTLGLQVRHDYIPNVALFNSANRQLLTTVNQAEVNETSVGLYGQLDIQWLEKLRTIIGLRGSFYAFDVRDRLDASHSGNKSAAIVSPKFSLILGPWYDTEAYLNAGYGYHSNDARAVTAATDPATPLAWSRGGELGFRTRWVPGLNSTLAFWYLELDSELVWVGDAGTTEAQGSSERYGIEWTNYYQVTDWLTLDADFAFTHSEFKDAPSGEDKVPQALGTVITTGATMDLPNGIFGSIRMRHFDDVPLNESGSIDAGSTTLVNTGLGYRYRNWRLEANVFNLFDRRDHDIAYLYESRLRNETSAHNDLHFHPVERRTFRLQLTYHF